MTFLSQQQLEDGKLKGLKSVKGNLEKFDKESGHAQIKVNYESEDIDLSTAIPATTLDQAEQIVLQSYDVFSPLSTPPSYHPPEEQFGQNARRAVNNIQSMTGRAAGNTIIYHPAQEEKVRTIVDLLHDNMEYIASENCLESRILVMYRGTSDLDQPLIYVDGTGIVLNNVFADANYYGKFVKIG
jgi:hypothetical protein